MAVHTSPVFDGYSGSINRQLLLKQRFGKTIVTKFPDRSRVVYSENQRREQRRFADAVSFARVVITNKILLDEYSLKAALLGFRSPWNMAIAEYMSTGPLRRKPQKIKFKKSILTCSMGKNISLHLFKLVSPGTKHFQRIKEKPENFRSGSNRKAPPPLLSGDLRLTSSTAV